MKKNAPHECEACGGWKADTADYCHACIKYKEDMLKFQREQDEIERAKKRAEYFALQYPSVQRAGKICPTG